MKAVVFAGTRSVEVPEVPDAVLEEPTDVVIRVTSSAICGTDLHMYDGRTGAEPGLVLGHEPLGVVEQAGSAVEMVTPGDRVVIPTHLYCGVCVNCARGPVRRLPAGASRRIRRRLRLRRDGPVPRRPGRAAPGALTPTPTAVRVPGEAGDELEDDLVMLADAFVTGWHATELARVFPGCTAAVFGAGTIGLLSAYSCLLRGADVVYVVDYIPERLEMAARLGAVPVDFRAGDPVEQIRAERGIHGLPPGEEPMNGVDIVIDAVGFQGRDRAAPAPDRENPAQVVGDLARLVNPTGHAGIIGVYAEQDLHPVPPGTADGHLPVPWATFFAKGVSVGFGRTHDRRYTVLLRDMVLSGRARPAAIVTHHGRLDDAPAFYQAFDRRADGVIKAVLQPVTAAL